MNAFFGYKILMMAVVALPLVALFLFLVNGLPGGANPENEHYEAGLQLHRQGRFQSAIAEYDKSISLDRRDPLVYAKRGDSYYALREFEQALADYDRAISMRAVRIPRLGSTGYLSLEQALAESYMGRAMVYTALGSDRDAQQNVGQAIEFGYDQDLAREKLDGIKSLR